MGRQRTAAISAERVKEANLSSLDSGLKISSAGDVASALEAILMVARAKGCARASCECVGTESEIRFYSKGARGEAPLESHTVSSDALRPLHLGADERSFLWPVPRDPLFATNVRRRRL